eukprot:3933772-Rhodomonas_salina.1
MTRRRRRGGRGEIRREGEGGERRGREGGSSQGLQQALWCWLFFSGSPEPPCSEDALSQQGTWRPVPGDIAARQYTAHDDRRPHSEFEGRIDTSGTPATPFRLASPLYSSTNRPAQHREVRTGHRQLREEGHTFCQKCKNRCQNHLLPAVHAQQEKSGCDLRLKCAFQSLRAAVLSFSAT